VVAADRAAAARMPAARMPAARMPAVVAVTAMRLTATVVSVLCARFGRNVARRVRIHPARPPDATAQAQHDDKHHDGADGNSPDVTHESLLAGQPCLAAPA
jgi:hypothetical protein